jgi:hypothetical protein
MITQLDEEREKNYKLELQFQDQSEEISKLTKTNEALFTENYSLLKYKFLYE